MYSFKQECSMSEYFLLRENTSRAPAEALLHFKIVLPLGEVLRRAPPSHAFRVMENHMENQIETVGR